MSSLQAISSLRLSDTTDNAEGFPNISVFLYLYTQTVYALSHKNARI